MCTNNFLPWSSHENFSKHTQDNDDRKELVQCLKAVGSNPLQFGLEIEQLVVLRTNYLKRSI